MRHNTKTFSTNLLTLALFSSSLCALPALAQEQSNEEESKDVERIVVTGSRIARDPNLAAPSPVQAIDAKDIKQSGEFSITDVVNDIPALFSSTSSESSIDSAFADGANILNLRGLGSARTLVLVNGRRHVGGVQGSAAVDVGSIPVKLIERVEVLTGGASAVYGADAVTGVVNFILKKDFEGFELDAQQGISGDGDAKQTTLSALYGASYADGKGNFTINVDYRTDEGLRVNERDNGLAIGSGRDWVNPAKRFQQGDIDASSMPNFAQYYNFANTGLVHFGLPIPSQDGFISSYTDQFGSAPNLTQAEIALINAAAAAPNRAVLPYRTFPFTSGYGLIAPGNAFTFAGFDAATNIDLNNNGIPDCADSWTGWNSSFAPGAYGALGGCWNVGADGSYAPTSDGLVGNSFQGFGGDSFNTIQQENGYIILPDDKITINLTTNYEFNDNLSGFAELKYADQKTENEAQPTSFWDLLLGAPDNPYLPEFIQGVAQETGGVSITIDPIGIGTAKTESKRTTTRFVAGLQGFLENDWSWETSITWGQFKRESTGTHNIINDRFFAAIDAVTDPTTGQPACRVEVDPNAPAQTTPFDIPSYDPGYYSFTPGSGQCVPLNIWAGKTGITQEALDWVTVSSLTEVTLEQTVLAASLSGDSADWFELPAGPVYFAVGGEYREESSEAIFDPYQRGVLPAGSAFTPGSNIADHSENSSLTFRPKLSVDNEIGEYDVWDVYFEASIPLIDGESYTEELTLDIAARYSDYSTIGATTTWRANLVWAPIEDLRFRLSQSQAVRAPNITELFGPEVGTTFRPADPCDAAQIDAIRADDSALASNIQSNCVSYFSSIGLDPFDGEGNYAFADPLSASFGGVTGGNPELQEETADTTTIGFVYQSSDIEGLSISIDRWDISIEDAISAVSSQNIVDGCYRGQSLNENFCSLFTRNSDSSSAQYGGFNFLRSSSVNFAKLETSGYDFSVAYDFNIDAHKLGVRVAGSKVDKLDNFSNPLDLTDIDPELGEVNRPELAGNISLSWEFEDITIGWQSQYMDEQLLSFVEIETAETLYGDAVFMDEFWQHDLSFSYTANDDLEIYGGIKNITEEEPFMTDFAYPASPRGRYFFLGVNYKM